MHAKVSRHGLRFFAHAPGSPTCALALETIAHHLLKLELANAARSAGAHAEMEVRGPGGAWRADVMASGPGGAWRWALEAQLAPITVADITARTERMCGDGVPSIWFSDRPRVPWLGAVPSARLAASGDSQNLLIDGGLMKFNGDHWWPVEPVLLAQFLDWAFTGRIVASKRRIGGPGLVWTAPRYIQAEDVAERGWQAQVLRMQEDLSRVRVPSPGQINAVRAAARGPNLRRHRRRVL